YIPDYTALNGTNASRYCRYSYTRGSYNCPANYNTTLPYMWDPPFHAADWNHLSYNPNVTYQPPLKADGTPLTYNVGTVTDANGNQIGLLPGGNGKVQSDPFLSPATLVSFYSWGGSTATNAGLVQVPLYCNSDWPLDASIGTNGEYQIGKGKDCRINGTAYDAAANGAPAVIDDYQYPWHPAVPPLDP